MKGVPMKKLLLATTTCLSLFLISCGGIDSFCTPKCPEGMICQTDRETKKSMCVVLSYEPGMPRGAEKGQSTEEIEE
jgi:hypothetical protein